MKIPCKSRAFTAEEARKHFLDHIRVCRDYWNSLEKTDKEKLDGLCFSILSLIDGVSGMPSLDLVLKPHPSDKQFYLEQKDNYYESGMIINDCYLHDEWHTPC